MNLRPIPTSQATASVVRLQCGLHTLIYQSEEWVRATVYYCAHSSRRMTRDVPVTAIEPGDILRPQRMPGMRVDRVTWDDWPEELTQPSERELQLQQLVEAERSVFPKVLMSVKPKWAEKIFSSEKSLELRKSLPIRLHQGDWMAIYSSSPACQVLGTVQVGHLFYEDLDVIWKLAEKFACVTREEFDQYYGGREMGCAIEIKQTKHLEKSVRLDDIRQVIPGFQPPQSFLYLTEQLRWEIMGV